MRSRKEVRKEDCNCDDDSNFIPGLLIGAALTAFANIAFESSLIDDGMNWLQNEFEGTKTLKVVVPTEDYNALRYGDAEIDTIYPRVQETVDFLKEYDGRKVKDKEAENMTPITPSSP